MTDSPQIIPYLYSELADHPGGDRLYVAGDCGGHQWIFAQPSAP